MAGIEPADMRPATGNMIGTTGNLNPHEPHNKQAAPPQGGGELAALGTNNKRRIQLRERRIARTLATRGSILVAITIDWSNQNRQRPPIPRRNLCPGVPILRS